jgi:hypothetical protein
VRRDRDAARIRELSAHAIAVGDVDSMFFSTTSSTVTSPARTFAVGVTDQQGLTGTVLLLMTVLGLGL